MSPSSISGPSGGWCPGLGIAALEWTLVMTVFLVFIGLPLFIFGLAIAQAQES